MIAEAMLLMVVLFVFTYYVFDFFSAVHTGIVNQTHARTYLFETLQHRSNVDVLRNELKSKDVNLRAAVGYRFHMIKSEKERDLNMVASDVSLRALEGEDGEQILIRTGYGFCLTKGCK